MRTEWSHGALEVRAQALLDARRSPSCPSASSTAAAVRASPRGRRELLERGGSRGRASTSRSPREAALPGAHPGVEVAVVVGHGAPLPPAEEQPCRPPGAARSAGLRHPVGEGVAQTQRPAGPEEASTPPSASAGLDVARDALPVLQGCCSSDRRDGPRIAAVPTSGVSREAPRPSAARAAPGSDGAPAARAIRSSRRAAPAVDHLPARGETRGARPASPGSGSELLAARRCGLPEGLRADGRLRGGRLARAASSQASSSAPRRSAWRAACRSRLACAPMALEQLLEAHVSARPSE